MKQDGLQRLLDFLDLLNDNGIHFFIDQRAPRSLTVTLTIVGERVEALFTADETRFNCFQGHEDVEVDDNRLHELILQHHDTK